MDRNEKFIQKHNLLFAIALTVAGYISLVLGGKSVQSLSPQVAEVVSYIIPFIFLIAVKKIFKLKYNENLISVYDKNNPKTVKRFIMVVIITLIAMSIPLYLMISGYSSELAGKPLLPNAGAILIQLLLLNTCIGLFEEGLFRNIMMDVMLVDNKKSTYIKAFFATSILFGFIHLGNLAMAMNRPIAISSQVIYATFMGMLMAGLYFKYRNFYSLVFVHGLIDFLSMIPKLYGMNSDVTTTVIPDITLVQGAHTVITMIPTAIIGLLLLRSFLKKNIA